MNSKIREAAEQAREQVLALCPNVTIDIELASEFVDDLECYDCPEFLLVVTSNSFAILDPLSSECGRFPVDPSCYGLTREAATIIRRFNRIEF
jgi:hypothetical protein